MQPVVVVVNKLLVDISKVSVELKEKSKARKIEEFIGLFTRGDSRSIIGSLRNDVGDGYENVT